MPIVNLPTLQHSKSGHLWISDPLYNLFYFRLFYGITQILTVLFLQNDVDFKGYYTLICQERCVIDFHSQCWKHLKEEEVVSNDKEFLERECLTPGNLLMLDKSQFDNRIKKTI